MNPEFLLKGDLIMLPKKGSMPTRNVLLTSAEPIGTYTSDGDELFYVTWLGNDGIMQNDMILKPASVTLISRRNNGDSD
tara:strand:+ start:267 stop:503 length:237 start_codon:yes stop_codon:yes gene_type:complete